nr:MAG TPA_asm: hypothetical protein [Caudoviricetes sp.]
MKLSFFQSSIDEKGAAAFMRPLLSSVYLSKLIFGLSGCCISLNAFVSCKSCYFFSC